jgi:RNA polymerase sigma-70 factor (ECF subfamily)
MTTEDFESILLRHQSMVYSIAYNFFRNAATAEEVSQDVFLQLYETPGAPRSEAHVAAWLRKTTTHRCIDAARRRSYANEIAVDALPDLPATASDGDPLLQERLRRLVASLPEKPRMVMILRYTEDLDPEEIGEALGMPVRTVWSHLQRGLALLREKAARYLREESNEPIR